LEKRRESLWEKWEENLETAQDPLAQVNVPEPVLQRAGTRKEFMEHALIEAQETERRLEIEAARRRLKERRDAEDAERRAQEEQVATRLHREYIQNANGLTSTSSFTWALGMALVVILAGFVIRRFLHIVFNIFFRTYPLGGTENVDKIAIALTVLGAGYAAWKGSKQGVANIKELVKNFDVARREAENAATTIAMERLRRESPNAKQYEIDVAVRAETLEQLRQVYRSSTIAMMKHNSGALYAFGIGIGTFIVGSAIVLGLHASAKPDPTNLVRALSVMVGLILTSVASVRLADVGRNMGRKQHVE
jgi:hypothetical protein